MWQRHLCNLFLSSWQALLSVRSATTVSTLLELLLPCLVFAVSWRVIGGKDWLKLNALKEKGKDLAITSGVTVLFLLAFLCVGFAIAIPCVVYEDHQELVRKLSELNSKVRSSASDNETLRKEIEQLRAKPADNTTLVACL